MPHSQNHRGAHPEDPELFSPNAVAVLRVACEEASWLLGRGYTPDSVLDVVGRRHQLRSRQRLALQRSMCSKTQAEARRRNQVSPENLSGTILEIDGFNLIIGLEVAISRGVLLRGLDGAWRDLAGLRGSYHTVEETDSALALLGTLFHELNIACARFYLDSPVSNSGRLKTRIRECAQQWACAVDVLLVPNPDRELVGREEVVSSDSLVLDTAKTWVNLLDHALRFRLANAWLVDLGSQHQPA